MLPIVFILGMRAGNRKSQKPRDVKTEAAVETARDLRESQSRECAESPRTIRSEVRMDHKMLEPPRHEVQCSALHLACSVAGEMIGCNNNKVISNIYLLQRFSLTLLHSQI